MVLGNKDHKFDSISKFIDALSKSIQQCDKNNLNIGVMIAEAKRLIAFCGIFISDILNRSSIIISQKS